jgi:oligoribonuclease NrnB/cAMP/cGMP phosphodiesterase (DHH superfamily)
MSKLWCIYHGGCPDGFTAAWVVGQRFGEDVAYHAGRYGAPPPDCIETDAAVFIVDFSYPRDQLVELCDRVAHVEVYDHHASAQRDLDGLTHDRLAVVFDMDRSGAGITWDELFPAKPRPLLVDYVEDRDLWRFSLVDSEDVAPLFMGTEMDFAAWDSLADALDTRWDMALAQGRAMRQMREKIIAEIASTARLMRIAEFTVPVAGSPYALGSDVAGVLAEGAHFAAYYVDRPEHRQFGLRSTDHGLDVSLIAGQYGGGGHRHAAGFTVPWGHPLAGGS